MPATHLLTMGAGAGKLITLEEPCTLLDIFARAECFVRPRTAAQAAAVTPAAPGASPAPGAGAQVAGWIRLKAAEKVQLDLLRNAQRNLGTAYSHVEVWGVAADDLQVVGV